MLTPEERAEEEAEIAQRGDNALFLARRQTRLRAELHKQVHELMRRYASNKPLLMQVCVEILNLAKSDPMQVLLALEADPNRELVRPLLYAVGLLAGFWVPTNEMEVELGEVVLEAADIPVPPDALQMPIREIPTARRRVRSK